MDRKTTTYPMVLLLLNDLARKNDVFSEEVFRHAREKIMSSLNASPQNKARSHEASQK